MEFQYQANPNPLTEADRAKVLAIQDLGSTSPIIW